MSKTIIQKMVLQLLVPKQQYNTNEEVIKACKFLNSYPDRTQNWFHISVINVLNFMLVEMVN
jgi:hypothetical protein